MAIALDVGCGDKLYQNNHPKGDYQWVGLDKHDFSLLYEEGEFVQHDVKDPLPFEDDSIELIWTHHLLEHLVHRHPTEDMDFVIYVINEFGRVLRPKRRVHIVVPWSGHTNAWRAPHHYRYFNEDLFAWFDDREGLWAEHSAAGLLHNWKVFRNEIVDECHVYAILQLE